jgi:uncharacterized protein (TIGR04255 family)
MGSSASTRDSESNRAQHSPEEHILTFDRPPVSEVVCGVGFSALEKFSVAEAGRYWARIAARYPLSEIAAPLPPPGVPFSLPAMQWPRQLFRSPDATNVVQLQNTWFLFNWVRTKGNSGYPRYPVVFSAFSTAFEDFQAYLLERTVGAIKPLQYRLTYVNHIPKSEGWATPDDVRRFLPDFFSQWPTHSFVSKPNAFSLQFSSEMRPGRLDVSVKNGATREDPEEVFVFELSVTSLVEPKEASAMKLWFDSAREVIVRSFKDLTSKEAHQKWGLHE